MMIDFIVKRREHVTCQIYCAEILGSHETYRFQREFLPLEYGNVRGESEIRLECELPSEGVYEMSIKFLDPHDKTVFQRQRMWICLHSFGFFFLYDPDDVLPAVKGCNALIDAEARGIDLSDKINAIFHRLMRKNWWGGGMPPWVTYKTDRDTLLYHA